MVAVMMMMVVTLDVSLSMIRCVSDIIVVVFVVTGSTSAGVVEAKEWTRHDGALEERRARTA